MKNRADCVTKMEQEIKMAWKNDEFRVYLQPQVNVESGEIEGFEALLRWEHPTRGILLPGQFLPVMKGLRMLECLDYLVFEKVCAFLGKRAEEAKPLFCVSCNFVREHFVKDGFVETLEKIRRKYKVPSNYLAVEIMEGAAFTDEQAVQANVEVLEKHGYPVYLDDYGADQSAFGDLYLHSISHIKVDKKMVEHIELKNARILLQGLCDIAHRLNYRVVCEGVETQREMELVRECGVDIIQGFYFYQPMNISRAEYLYDEKC